MKKLLTVMATMALAMALSAVSFAQQDQSAQPSTQQPSSSSDMQNGQQTSTDQQGAEPSSPSPDSSSSTQNTQGSSFTGTVVKAAGKYVLKTSDMNYQLDDQDKAMQFVGQQVKINGTLDSSTSMIHIADISPLS